MRSKRYIQPRDDRRRNGPVVIVRPADEPVSAGPDVVPDRGLWREALFLARGDVRRLRVEPDGSVTVVNAAAKKAAKKRAKAAKRQAWRDLGAGHERAGWGSDQR